MSQNRGVDYIGVTIAFMCHDGKEKILLHKRSINCRDEHGRWDNGAGALEFGESFEECVIREVKEEYCVDALEMRQIGVYNNLREHQGTKTHWVTVLYAVRVDPMLVKNGEPHKIDQLDWFDLDKLPEPPHSALHRDVQLFKEAKIFAN